MQQIVPKTENKPDTVPQVAPKQEKTQPVPQKPGTAKQTKQTSKPTEKKDSVNTKKDNTKKKVTTSPLPQYPTGSEGDDPLFE